MTDSNFSQSFIQISKKLLSLKTESNELSFLNYEAVREVKLSFYEVTSPFTITKITFANHNAFHFSVLRVVALFLIAQLVNLIVIFEVYKWEFCKKNKVQRIILIVIFILLIGIISFLRNPNDKATKYSEGDYLYADPFLQMFDSSQHKTLQLLAEVENGLEELENPYDRSIRDSSGLYGFWDRSMYDGHYYAYFGFTPVIIYYYPFYYLSGGYLPSINDACLFFGILASVFMFEAAIAFLERFTKKINFLVLCIFLVSAPFLTGITHLIARSNFYMLPPLCSSALLFMCLYFGLKGSMLDGVKRYVFLALSGLSFILCFESRITKSICALVLAPVFLEILFNKANTKKDKCVCVSSFMGPIIIGLTLVFWKNFSRFDSIFEFGTNYQLTVNNIRANTLTLRLLPASIFNYFLQPVGVRDYFPYLVPSQSSFGNYGRYLYQYECLGILNYPLIAIGLSLCVIYLIYNWKKNDLVKKYTVLLGLFLMVLIAWIVECKAGTILYYTTEILPIAFLLSFLLVNDYAIALKNNKKYYKSYLVVLGIAFIVSMVICLSHTMIYTDTVMSIVHMDWENYLDKIIFFWH